MFAKLKLSQRILLGYLAPLLLLLGAMVLVFVNLQEDTRAANEHDTVQSIMQAAQGMSLDLVRMQRSTRGYLLNKTPDMLKEFQDNETAYKVKYELLQREVKDPQQRDTLLRMGESIKTLAQQQHMLLDLVGQGKETEAIAQYRSGQVPRMARELDDLANSFLQQENEITKGFGEKEDAAIRMVTNSIIYGMLGAIAMSVAIALWLAAAISRNITASATQLSAASSEIAATIAQHERTASQQAAAVNETSSTIDELSASSRQSAEQAANSAALAERSSTATVEGSDATQQAVDAMSSLKDKIGAMADQILHLGEQTGQIGNIATLLKDLAGQINMLALNAAVEAARAGEHGKGFAVVAEEVRKHAEESQQAAHGISELIGGIQGETTRAVDVVETGARRTEDGATVVKHTREAFMSIGEAVDDMAGRVEQIASSSTVR